MNRVKEAAITVGVFTAVILWMIGVYRLAALLV